MDLTAIIVAVIMFLLGFLLGWFVEWRIDLSYWRTVASEAAEVDEAPGAVAVLPTASAPQLMAGSQETLVSALREQVAQREADLAALRGTLEQLSTTEARRREQEAELMDEARRLREQLDDVTAAKIDADAEWRHEFARREQQWHESKETEGRALRAEIERLQTELADAHSRLERLRAVHASGLTAIRGIGPKIESDLRRVGISSYAELAARTPGELQLLLNPPKWRRLDFESWIAQAAVLARNELA